jgi:hypothetical protein
MEESGKEPSGASFDSQKWFALGLAGFLLLGGLVVWLRSSTWVEQAVGDTFVIPYVEQDDLTAEDRAFLVGDLLVKVSMTRPALPLATIDFRVLVEDGKGPMLGLNVELAFNMKMDIGRIVYRLVPSGTQYQAQVTLPTCMKGGKRWFGRLRFNHSGHQFEKIFFFDLQ